MQIKDNIVYFDKDFLSPFYVTHFGYPNEMCPMFFCNCSEQCFQAVKALLFKDYKSLEYIMNCIRADDLYKNGHNVINYDKKLWRSIKYNTLFNIELQKYKQDIKLREQLLNPLYDNKKFVYCNPIDTYWGIGLGIYNSNIYNKSKWKGENKYGEIIFNIRNILMKER